MFQRALTFREGHSREVGERGAFMAAANGDGGFIHAHWCGDPSCEAAVKDETRNTIRCIPMHWEKEEGACAYCGGASERKVAYAQAY
jgi:prolyl-tRNA synthetase